MDITIKRPVYISPTILGMPITEEILDTQVSTGTRRVTWTSQDGRERDIRELADDHLVNLNGWLGRHRLLRTLEIISSESIRRQAGEYPPDFDDLVEAYKAQPETWRLKVYD